MSIVQGPPTQSGFTIQTLSTELQLNAGDYVEVDLIQNTGSDINVRARNFTMSWVAPG